MNIRRNVLWITRTAVLIALLVAVQFFTASFGNTIVTGSCVNLVLVVSFLIGGLATGLTVAIISPVFASLAGVGPAFPPLVPFIALGNAVFVAVWFLLSFLNKSDKTSVRYRVIGYLIAIISAAIKFLTLYTGIVLIAVPYILRLNEKQSAMLTFSFSYPQLITATIGGVIALSLVPPIQKAINTRTR